jgi:hypothetical protein
VVFLTVDYNSELHVSVCTRRRLLVSDWCKHAGDMAAGEDVNNNDNPEGQEHGSVCDRLRNATAYCVKQVHKLLGDPAIVGTEVEDFYRQKYYRELDKQCVELWQKTKKWTGGQDYVQNIKNVVESCLFPELILRCCENAGLHMVSQIGF